MPESKKHLLTASGRKELNDELSDLKVNKRLEVAQMLKEAREQGDLSENAEYDAAKDEKDRIEARIREIEDDDTTLDTVTIGRKVKVLDVEMGEEMDYIIVGGQEADPFSGRISNDSPVGRALIGAKVGESIMADTPAGALEFKVLSVTKAE